MFKLLNLVKKIKHKQNNHNRTPHLQDKLDNNPANKAPKLLIVNQTQILTKMNRLR